MRTAVFTLGLSLGKRGSLSQPGPALHTADTQ